MTEKFECTYFHLEDYAEGKTLQGSWRMWAICRGIEVTAENSVRWPPKGSDLEASLNETAIGQAVLLGAQFFCGTIDDPNWTNGAWRLVDHKGEHYDFFQTQGDAAVGYLSRRGYWLAHNKAKDEWELVKI